MTIDELKISKELINTIVNTELINSVVPIFIGDSELHVDQLGTGFYVVYHEHYYLITADHVLSATSNVLYPDSEKTLGTIPYKNPVGSKEVDIGVYPLVEPLKYLFMPFKLTDELIPNFKNGSFFCCGYPATKCKFFNKKVQNIFKTFLTTYDSNPNTNHFSIDERYEIPLVFDRKHVISYEGNETVFPYPNGMSGGPLFSFSCNNNSIGYQIAGIMTRYNANDEKTMVATNIRFVQLILEKIEKK